MTFHLVVLWLHVLGAVVWIGGLMHQAQILLPAARRGSVGLFADAARRGRPVAWTAIALVALTGFYNVTRLGPVERVMESGTGLVLARPPVDGLDDVEPLIEEALREAAARGVAGQGVTPFVLAFLHERSGGRTLGVNRRLAADNAGLAGDVAVAFSRSG